MNDAGMLALDGGNPNPITVDIQRMRDLRNETSANMRADARSAALRDAVVEAVRLMPPIETRSVQTVRAGEQSLLLAIGDMHYGADWKITGLYGEAINEYNPEVFEMRMWKLLSETTAILEKEKIDHIDLMLCGDLLDGMLRNSQLMKLRYGVVESCMRLAEYLSQWLSKLSEHATVTVYGVDGNHGEIRPLGSRKGEFENENMEKIILWYLGSRFEDSHSVRIDPVCEKKKLVKIQGYTVIMVHGEDDKSLESFAKQTVLLYGEPIDFYICAHKHRAQEAITGYTSDGNSIVMRVPSICGMDRFAQKLGFGGKPGALAVVMERGVGRRCTYPITL